MYIAEIAELQADHKKWLDHNFPNQDPLDGFLGIVEEVGEIAHSILKRKQGIRGTDAEHTEAIKDGLGDVFIFMMSYCNSNHLDLAEIIEQTWDGVVSKRDWATNQKDGVNA